MNALFNRFNALSFHHKRAEQRAPKTTGIQTKAPYDKTHLVYLVVDMVMLCGRYGLWPIRLWRIWYTLWLIWSCFVADMVCGQYRCGRCGLWPIWYRAIVNLLQACRPSLLYGGSLCLHCQNSLITDINLLIVTKCMQE